MNLKKCPFMGATCEYHDCMLFNQATSQCSISVIAVELQATSANTGAMADTLADTLAEISDELSNITTAVKGLV